MLFFSGCGTQTLAISNSPDTSALQLQNKKIDAGIVFADRAGYLCLPFTSVGLPSDARVISLTSSCDCVTPGTVEYIDANKNISQGILLEFDADSSPPSSMKKSSGWAPVHLQVIVEVSLRDKSVHRFTVNLIHTLSTREP
jgi:hypothetical protein